MMTLMIKTTAATRCDYWWCILLCVSRFDHSTEPAHVVHDTCCLIHYAYIILGFTLQELF